MKGEEIYKSHRERLNKVYKDNTRPPDNLVLMNRFIRRAQHSGLSPESIKTNISTFAIFSKWCILPIKDLTEDDIFDFLDYLHDYTYTKNGEERHYSPVSIQSYKTVLKKFFKSVGKTELIESLQGRVKNDKVIERDQLLSKADIESLLTSSMNSRDRSLISILYEAGPRRGELLSVKCRHIEFDANGVKMTFPEGKTGPRTVRLVFSASYLRAWLRDHPIKKGGKIDPEAYLFVSLQGGFSQLTDMGLYKQLQKIAKRAGITKRVNPHSFRHARATELAEHLTEQQMKKFLGWSQDSRMCSTYVHDPDTEGAVLGMYGLKVEETYIDGLKVGRCPWCKELNPESYSFCGVCGRPLNQDALDKITVYENQLSQILDVYSKLASGQVTLEEIRDVTRKE